jgi:hypothetical protein
LHISIICQSQKKEFWNNCFVSEIMLSRKLVEKIK